MNQTLRVVVVDDSAAYRMALGMALERVGEVVGEASNGFDGYRIVQRNNPDVVVVDVHMPEFGGLELIGLLRQLGAASPRIVAYSGNREMLQAALDTGAHAAVVKSSDAELLLDAILDSASHSEIACA